MSNPECRLEWKKNFYSEEFLKKVDYGCYSPSIFQHDTVDGVYGAYVQEGVCPIHGVVASPLGGVTMLNKPTHPCGAYKKEQS